MNKKILITSVLLLAVVMLATPLVAAKPGAEKKNEKFVSFGSTKIGGPPVGPITVINRPAPPKETEFRRMIIPEGLSYGDLIIDGVAYYFGADFTYDSILTLDFHLNSDPVFATITVVYSYIFTEASGIDGSLDCRAVGKYWADGQSGDGITESWVTITGFGTDDLAGVKVKATGWHEPTGEIVHEGIVTGWPVFS